jgi:hypothetical protein
MNGMKAARTNSYNDIAANYASVQKGGDQIKKNVFAKGGNGGYDNPIQSSSPTKVGVAFTARNMSTTLPV